MRSEYWTRVSVFAGALVLRLLHLQQVVANDPFYTQPSVDSRVYRDWGLAIAGGDWLGHEPFFLTPLYGYSLGALYAIAGPGHLAPLVLNALLGAAMALAVYLLALRLFDRRVALVAAALAATYRMEIFYEGVVLVETLQTFLTAALMLVAVAAFDLPTIPRFLGVGALVGLSALARQNALLLAPLLAVLPFTRLVASPGLARRVSLSAAVVAGALLVVAPVTLRNWVVSEDVVLVNSTGGMLLYEGWNPEATGFYTIPGIVPRALADDPLERRLAYRSIAEQRTGRTGLTASEVSSYWRAEALRFVFHHPGRALALGLWKARLFWSAFEGWDNRSFDVSRSSSWVLELPLVPFSVLGPLALLGVVLSAASWRRLVPLYLVLAVHFATVVIFFALSRFRVTALPVFSIFAAAAVVGVLDRARAREPGRLGLAVALLAAASVAVNLRTPSENLSMAHFNLGNAYKELGRYDEAVDAYFESLALDPTYLSTWNNLALVYERSGVELELVARTWQRVLDLARAQGSALHVERAERHLHALAAR